MTTSGHKGYDPAQLLRRSWSGDVDALAQELYVLFTTGVRPADSIAGLASAVGETTPLLVQPAGRPVPSPVAAEAAQRAVRIGQAMGAIFGSSVQPSRPEAHRGAQIVSRPALAAQRPSVAVSSGTPSAASREAVVRPVASTESLAASAVREVVVPVPGGRDQSIAVARGGEPVATKVDPLSPARVRGAGSVPVESPGPRRLAVPGPVAPPDLTVSRPIESDFARGFFANPVVLAQAASGIAIEASRRSVVAAEVMGTHLQPATEAERKPTSAGTDRRRRPREWGPLSFDQKALGFLLPSGVTGLSYSSGSGSGPGATLATPGYGQFYLVEFDGSVLTYGDDMAPQDVWNLSIFPVSGQQLWYVERVGEYFFMAHRQLFVHGIISATISPCVGTMPGRGQVVVYFLSQGAMTAGPTINVENWYAVTGAVGKHCGLMEADGTAALEVLDC